MGDKKSEQIIELYSELARDPKQDFGWEKGRSNALAQGYKIEDFKDLPEQLWDYCAAVGNPFSLGPIQSGARVLDLGCGAGVDLLVAASLVGDGGKAIGLDLTPKMLEKAKEHASLAGLNNIELIEGSFDEIALDDESVDIVISNGAINLGHCKEAIFAEIYRVLVSGGRLYFADMINTASTSCCSQTATECCESETAEADWANCVEGTLAEDVLIAMMQEAGFHSVECVEHTNYKTSNTTIGATFRATK